MHLNVSRSAWAFKISMKEGWRSTALFTIFVCIWLNRLRNKKVSEWINAWKQHVIAADRGATLESHWFCCFLSSLNIVNRFEKVQFTVINWKLIPLQQLSEKKMYGEYSDINWRKLRVSLKRSFHLFSKFYKVSVFYKYCNFPNNVCKGKMQLP